MNKKVFTAAIALMGLCATATFAQEEVGVKIGDITWATRNVNTVRTFVTTPQDPGRFYQWNRMNASFSVTDPMESVGGNWSSMDPTVDEWAEANDPCPMGWRIPLKEEFEKLIDSGGAWTTDPVPGFRFGSGANTLFFPEAGSRFHDAKLYNYETIGEWGGAYWTKETRDIGTPYIFFFDEERARISYINGRSGLCIRCVKGGIDTSVTFVPTEDTETITGYYSITGQRLPQAPEKGIYIIKYNTGKTVKMSKQ